MIQKKLGHQHIQILEDFFLDNQGPTHRHHLRVHYQLLEDSFLVNLNAHLVHSTTDPEGRGNQSLLMRV